MFLHKYFSQKNSWKKTSKKSINRIFCLFQFSYPSIVDQKWVVVQEHIVHHQLIWNAQDVTITPSDAVIIVDLAFAERTSMRTCKLVLAHGDILKDYSDVYQNVVTATMMQIVVVVVAITKCVTLVSYAVINTIQYIGNSIFFQYNVEFPSSSYLFIAVFFFSLFCCSLNDSHSTTNDRLSFFLSLKQ